MISIPYRRSLLVALLAFTVLVAGRVAAQVNAEQSLRFAGLRSVNQAGEAKAVVTDAVGDIYLAYDQGDGVRLLKVANDGNALLGQVQLGAKGDSAVALAIDPAGNLYVAGTSTSGALEATPGAAIPVATPGTTNSFVAKFDGNLDELFLTFTGGSRIAASAVAASADAVAVTGITYGSDLPVTANAILQSPAYGSFQNGFVESFSADGSTIEYATYITGALGDTTPTGIALDAVDDVYLAGATTASGFPTVNALIPNSLSNPSGFLLSLTPAGDGIDFSTFVPGPGLSAVALDATGQNLLVTGAVNLGAFPVDTVTAPLVSTIYQVLLRMPLDGSSVESGTVLAAAQASSVAATSDGGAWIGGAFPQGQAPLLAYPPLAGLGGGWAVHLTVQGAVDQTLRLGGQANQQQAFASLPSPVEGVAADGAGDLFVAGAIQPTASSSLLATETYDLPLRGGPTLALPSALADAKATAATCSGSLCGGSAGFLASVSVQAAQPALAFSLDDLPMVRLRNLGSAAATALQLAASAGSFSADCPTALPPGGVCEILLSGGAAGTLTATYNGTSSETVAFPAYQPEPAAGAVSASHPSWISDCRVPQARR